MKQAYSNIFGKVYLTVTTDKHNRWVHNDWAGYLTMDNVKSGALAYLKAVKEAGFSCVLNDNSKVLGSWDHSLDWASEEWAPLAAEAGVKYFALIITPDSMVESSAVCFSHRITEFNIKVFSNIEEAKRWLGYHSLAKQ